MNKKRKARQRLKTRNSNFTGSLGRCEAFPPHKNCGQLNHLIAVLKHFYPFKNLFRGLPASVRKQFELREHFCEGSQLRLTRRKAELANLMRQLAAIDVKIHRNENDRPKNQFREGRSLPGKVKIGVLALCIVAAPFVGTWTAQQLIQSGSDTGSHLTAWTSALSLWFLAVGAKCSVEAGPLKPFKWWCDLAAVSGLLVFGFAAIYEVGQTYMIQVVETTTDHTDFFAAQTDPENPKIIDRSRLFAALLLAETFGLYLMLSGWSKAVAPERDERDVAIESDNQDLERKRALIQRQVPRCQAQIAALEERARRSNALPNIVNWITREWSKQTR